MGRVPGEPLGTAPLTEAQVDALGAALRRLFAVPLPDDLPERAMGPSVARGKVREWAAEPYDLSPCQDADLVGDALDRARDLARRRRPGHRPRGRPGRGASATATCGT